jgi:hypothetical protein
MAAPFEDINYLDLIKKLKGYFVKPEGNVEIGKPEVLKYGAEEAPTIDLKNRPEHRMPDGSTATVRSMGINMDGKHALIPTISPKGELWDDDSAVENYRKTNEHMGLYPDDETSDRAGQKIHEDQARMLEAKRNNRFMDNYNWLANDARQRLGGEAKSADDISKEMNKREDIRLLLGRTPEDLDDSDRPK